MNELCEVKHKAIDDKLDLHSTQIEDHYKRIGALETNSARIDVKMDNVCDRVGKLTTAIWWFIGTTFVTLLGFFVWYVQNL